MGGKPFKRRSGPNYRTPDGREVTPLAFMHPCEADGCDAWGSFGFKVSLLRGEPGHWFCQAHRHMGEALYASSTHQSDHGAKGEPHEQPPADKPADGA